MYRIDDKLIARLAKSPELLMVLKTAYDMNDDEKIHVSEIDDAVKSVNQYFKGIYGNTFELSSFHKDLSHDGWVDMLSELDNATTNFWSIGWWNTVWKSDWEAILEDVRHYASSNALPLPVFDKKNNQSYLDEFSDYANNWDVYAEPRFQRFRDGSVQTTPIDNNGLNPPPGDQLPDGSPPVDTNLDELSTLRDRFDNTLLPGLFTKIDELVGDFGTQQAQLALGQADTNATVTTYQQIISKLENPILSELTAKRAEKAAKLKQEEARIEAQVKSLVEQKAQEQKLIEVLENQKKNPLQNTQALNQQIEARHQFIAQLEQQIQQIKNSATIQSLKADLQDFDALENRLQVFREQVLNEIRTLKPEAAAQTINNSALQVVQQPPVQPLVTGTRPAPVVTLPPDSELTIARLQEGLRLLKESADELATQAQPGNIQAAEKLALMNTLIQQAFDKINVLVTSGVAEDIDFSTSHAADFNALKTWMVQLLVANNEAERLITPSTGQSVVLGRSTGSTGSNGSSAVSTAPRLSTMVNLDRAERSTGSGSMASHNNSELPDLFHEVDTLLNDAFYLKETGPFTLNPFDAKEFTA